MRRQREGEAEARAPEEQAEARAKVALNEQQRAIVELVAAGLVNKEIATKLGVSPSTVALELRLLYARAGVSRRAALIAKLWQDVSREATSM
jgi:DNA-binding NarL/FixJ family response regulator